MSRTLDRVPATDLNPFTFSLQTILFAVFVFACLSRWIAHFGAGVAVLHLWAAAVGSLIGVVIGGGAFAFSQFTKQRCTPHVKHAWQFRDVLACSVTGCVGGFLAGALGFAAATNGTFDRISAQGIWIEAPMLGPDARDASFGIGLFVLIPASIVSFAAALTQSMRLCQDRPWLLVTAVPALTAYVVCGVVSFVTLYAVKDPSFWAWWPILVLWLAFIGLCAAILGLFVSICWPLYRASMLNRKRRILLWSMTTIAILVVTEGALRGWFR